MKKLLLLSALFICFSGAAQEDSTKVVRTNGDLFIASGITLGAAGVVTTFSAVRTGVSMIVTGGVLTGVGLIINRVKKG